MSLSHGSGLGERVIGLAIAVHRHLGPGLLESAYEECLCLELKEAGITFRHQVPLPALHKNRLFLERFAVILGRSPA
jgi:GxxExxY protein